MKRLLKQHAFPLWIGVTAAMYALLLYMYRDLSPFYDGGIYYASIERLVTEPFRWVHLHMEGHVSPVYTLLIGVSQFIDQGNTLAMYAVNATLALFATVIFARLLQHLFGKQATQAEILLTASIYGLMPVFLTHIFHINLDLGLSVFFVPYVYFLLRKRLALSALFGLAMMLTKETGVLIYIATAGLYLPLYVLRPARSVRGAIDRITQNWLLLLPGALFSLYYLSFRFFASDQQAHWGEDSVGSNVVQTLLDFNIADPSIRAFLTNIFILNFNWVLSLVIIASVIHRAWRWTFGLPARKLPGVRSVDVLFMALLFIALIYITTRVRFWNNPRYVLAAYPTFLIVGYYCLLELCTRPRIRQAILGTMLTLTLLSNGRTIDPVSKAIYGTIPFGEHTWLDMTSMIGPDWLRRDPQAYNPEFLELHYATAQMLADVKPPADAVFLAGPAADFYVANRVDSQTFAPTIRREGSQRLRILDVQEEFPPDRLLPLLAQRQLIWYIAFPNMQNDPYLETLSEHYRLLARKTYGRRGYDITLFTFVLP